MHILIVHDDAEVGEQLITMVKEYTTHRCDLVESESAAHRWAAAHGQCRLLLTQLGGPAVDGFSLAGSLSEVFPGLQTFFFPPYSAEEQQIEIANTKVFPEPIDGERLLNAIETVAKAATDAADLFHVFDVLQMCCLSRRDGALQFVQPRRNGIVYLEEGRIVNAESATVQGKEALAEILTWGLAELAYDPSAHSPEAISLEWSDAVAQMISRDKEKIMPDAAERMREDEQQNMAELDKEAVTPQRKKRRFFSVFWRT